MLTRLPETLFSFFSILSKMCFNKLPSNTFFSSLSFRIMYTLMSSSYNFGGCLNTVKIPLENTIRRHCMGRFPHSSFHERRLSTAPPRPPAPYPCPRPSPRTPHTPCQPLHCTISCHPTTPPSPPPEPDGSRQRCVLPSHR